MGDVINLFDAQEAPDMTRTKRLVINTALKVREKGLIVDVPTIIQMLASAIESIEGTIPKEEEANLISATAYLMAQEINKSFGGAA
mgnify:CR=1 FL=1